MNSIFSFFNLIVLLGAMQGFIVSSLLLFSKKQLPSNRFMGGIIFLMALASLKVYLNSQEWFNSSTTWSLVGAFVPFFVIMPVGPLIYFYVKSFGNPGFKLTKADRRHFLPVIIDVVPHITAVIYVIGLLLHIFKNSPVWGGFIDQYYVYSDIPRWISMTVYILLAARLLSLQQIQKSITGESQQYGYRWLKLFTKVLMAFQAIWLLHLVPYVLPKYSDALLNSVDWFPVYLPLTVLIYWLGIKGYMMAIHQPESQGKKAGNLLSALSPSTIEQAVVLLQRSMDEQKLYLDPLLNLNALASYTGLPAKTISSVLNQYLNKSFNEFINGYRVEELKQKIQQPGMEKFTIAGIAFECGFNSQATFQRTFKDVTGMSPSEYRKTSSQL